MTLQTPISDVQATLTFQGSAESLFQILARINGTSTVSAAAVAEASTPSATAASTATSATKNTGAGTKAKAEKPAPEPEAPKTEPAADTQVETDAAGNAGSESVDLTGGAGDTSPQIPYEDVARGITDLVAKGKRDAAVAILAKFNAKTGQDLKPEQYADVLAEVAKAA